jgi:uncharacterized protein (TIGR02391 family)
MNKEGKLQLKFDPNTIDDLGAKLYSTLSPIISELIANGYDAGASEIHIEFNDSNPKNKTITIKDNGAGMSFDQINDHYLVVGRKRRLEKDTNDPIYNRPVMGKKGIGKLSFFGITDHAEITTIQNKKKVIFEMNREKIKGSKDYFPKYKIEDSKEKNGSIVKLIQVKRDENFDFQKLKNNIANYFLFDKYFRVFVKHNSGNYEEITNGTRYQQWDIQFSWEFPHKSYPYPQEIKGKIFTTKKPISKKLRGVALLSRKKLVNLPALFPIDTSSFFYEYLAGYLEVDFVDDLPDDVISTDRKTLSWGNPALASLEKWLEKTMKKIEQDWRSQWNAAKAEAIKSDPKIKEKEDTIITDEERMNFNKSVSAFSEADIDTDSAIKVMDKISEKYPEFHNKNLYPELESLTLKYYKEERYYDAVLHGVKRYITKIRHKISMQAGDDMNVIHSAFKPVGGTLSVTKMYESYKNLKTGGQITTQTKDNIKRGNHLLAEAMLAAFRNPLGHQEHEDLKNSEIYTAKDCLDALSLLSHLFRRLDNAELS